MPCHGRLQGRPIRDGEEPLPEPLSVKSLLSHPCWWGPDGAADPLSSLPSSSMLIGASGAQKPSP